MIIHITSQRIAAALLPLLFWACEQTPNPNYLPQSLGIARLAPWDAPLYSITEMEAFFTDVDYNSLAGIYVSTGGSDQTGDGSEAAPYRTLKFTLREKARPGVIVRVKAGTYYEEVIDVDIYARREKPLVIYSEDGAGAAIIDGRNRTENLLVISGQHIVVDGFEIRNSNGYGIGVFPRYDARQPARDSFTIIRNNIVHHTGRDAVKSAHVNFILIENNDISRVRHLNQYDDCIDGVAVYHSIARNNYLHDNGAGTGGYFKGGSANNIWYNNLIVNVGGAGDYETNGAGLNIGGWGTFSWRDNAWYDYPAAYGQLVFNNLFINCEMAGITIGSAQNSQIYNNSFYNCGYNSSFASSGAIIRVPEPNNVATADIDIFNNVVYNDAAHPFSRFFRDLARDHPTGLIRHGFNTIHAQGARVEWGYADGAAASERMEDPRFINPAANDLRLQSGSPAINSGTPLTDVPFDFLMNKRPLGPQYDRGAYEQDR